MSQTKHQIQTLLSQAGTHPRHRFGQNFMIDRNIVDLVVQAGELSGEDVVIEVGPGTGTLTSELLKQAGRVIAVEIDRDLASLIRRQFTEAPNFQLIEGDALAGKHELNPELLSVIAEHRAQGRRIKLVANLPYSIASPLIIELLIAGVELLAFTVQKEVAMRLRAVPDSDEYGPLSVMVQSLADVQVLRSLPPTVFWPAPKVESSLVRLRRHDLLGERATVFSRFVHRLFAARRKTLRKALKLMECSDESIPIDAGIDPQGRPETLSPEQFRILFSHYSE